MSTTYGQLWGCPPLPLRIWCGSPQLPHLAQLNFTIPDPLLKRLDAAKPDYLDRKGFLCLLLDQSLTASATLGKPSAETAAKPEQEKVLPLNSLTTKEEKRSKDKNKAANYVFSVPPELEEVKADLLEYWREYKKGRKSRAAGGMLITGCQAILEKYGATVLKEQIQLACANNWQSITLKGYEQFGLSTSKGYTPAQASEPNREYGTGRVFTADDFYGTTADDNPLQELF